MLSILHENFPFVVDVVNGLALAVRELFSKFRIVEDSVKG
jgi:hypothetical protein